jgi:diacylglycerol kinase family enzyme
VTKKSVVVLDYGSGNLRSAQRALERVGAEVEVTADAGAAARADGLVVPGVGAFEACMNGLRGIGGDKLIAERVAAFMQDRIGRGAYIFSGSRNLRMKPFRARIDVDGARWYKGKASCILLGNVGELFGGIEAFEDARPDDGKLDLGVVTADGLVEWGRMIARAAVGTPSKSPFAKTTKARSVEVKLNRRTRYELDGGDRTNVKAFKVKVEAGAITVCVPGDGWDSDGPNPPVLSARQPRGTNHG